MQNGTYQHSPYCEQGDMRLPRQLKHTHRDWNQHGLEHRGLCRDSALTAKGVLYTCSSTLLLMPADRLLYLCTWEIQTSSQPEKHWLQTNMTLLAYTTLNCCTSVSETCSTLVLTGHYILQDSDSIFTSSISNINIPVL